MIDSLGIGEQLEEAREDLAFAIRQRKHLIAVARRNGWSNAAIGQRLRVSEAAVRKLMKTFKEHEE